MNVATLFGKLREHEMELQRLKNGEQATVKTIALKAEKSREEKDNNEGESSNTDISLLVKHFSRFMKNRKKGQEKKENDKNPTSRYKCYGCGKIGHVKTDCPLAKKEDKRKEKRKTRSFKRMYAKPTLHGRIMIHLQQGKVLWRIVKKKKQIYA